MSHKPTPGKDDLKEVFCRYIIVKGQKIYPKKAKFFHFWIKAK